MFPILLSQAKYEYILDEISAVPLMAFSIRKLLKAYAGDCLKVRRSSDNAELDIGFIGASLDLAPMLAFVGGGDGFVTTWYDQTGNNLHATQTTAANQPRIITSGVLESSNGLPYIYIHPAANVGLTTGSANFGSTARSCFLVKRTLASSGSITIALWPVSGNGSANQSYDELFPPSVVADEYQVNAQGAMVVVSVVTPNSHQLEQMTLRFGSATKYQELYRNSVLLGAATATNNYPNITDQITFGSFPGAVPNLYMSEFIPFASAISDIDMAAYEQNAAEFYGLS